MAVLRSIALIALLAANSSFVIAQTPKIESDIKKFVDEWREAWERDSRVKGAAALRPLYDPRFRRLGTGWGIEQVLKERVRQARVARPFSVAISEVKVLKGTSAANPTVTFRQCVRMGAHWADGVKTLGLVQSVGGYRIISEEYDEGKPKVADVIGEIVGSWQSSWPTTANLDCRNISDYGGTDLTQVGRTGFETSAGGCPPQGNAKCKFEHVRRLSTDSIEIRGECRDIEFRCDPTSDLDMRERCPNGQQEEILAPKPTRWVVRFTTSPLRVVSINGCRVRDTIDGRTLAESEDPEELRQEKQQTRKSPVSTTNPDAGSRTP